MGRCAAPGPGYLGHPAISSNGITTSSFHGSQPMGGKRDTNASSCHHQFRVSTFLDDWAACGSARSSEVQSMSEMPNDPSLSQANSRSPRTRSSPRAAWFATALLLVATAILALMAWSVRSLWQRSGPISSAQYEAQHAWSDTLGGGHTLANLPANEVLVVTGITGVARTATPAHCGLSGMSGMSGTNKVTYRWQLGTQSTSPPVVGIRWPMETAHAILLVCDQPTTGVTVSGYLTPS